MAGTIIHEALDPAAATVVLYQDIGWTVAVAVFALGLRFLAGRVDKPRPRGEKRRRAESMGMLEADRATAKATTGTLRRALLFYRFHRPSANIVRIIFYLWTLSLPYWAAGFLLAALDERYYFPGNTVHFLAFIGYAVALRYWAALLETRRMGGEASRVAASATTADKSRGE